MSSDVTVIKSGELAKLSGVSPSTVFRYCKALNIPHREEYLPNGRRRYYYDRSAVELLEIALSERIRSMRLRSGMWRCVGGCGNYFNPSQLTSRMCDDCRAHKTVRNFAHRGDPVKFSFDPHLAEMLLSACQKILLRQRDKI